MATGFKGQIENRNFLSSIGFRFTLNRAPKVAFFSNTANIPSLKLGIAEQPTYLTTIPVPGDKMEFGDFNLRFLVDENLENYMEIQNWMRGLGFPESLAEIYAWQNNNESFEQPEKSDMNLYSDGTLLVLNSNQNFNFNVVFRSMFPYELGELKFDATNPDNEYFTAEVKFKYMMYNITNHKGEPLH